VKDFPFIAFMFVPALLVIGGLILTVLKFTKLSKESLEIRGKKERKRAFIVGMFLIFLGIVLLLVILFLPRQSWENEKQGAGEHVSVVPTHFPTCTPYPTYTAYPTYTPLPTYTPYPTDSKNDLLKNCVTLTPTPTATFTPSPTLATSTPTPTSTYTPVPLSKDEWCVYFGDGTETIREIVKRFIPAGVLPEVYRGQVYEATGGQPWDAVWGEQVWDTEPVPVEVQDGEKTYPQIALAFVKTVNNCEEHGGKIRKKP